MTDKLRIAVAGFQHETNTFAPMPTVWDNFVNTGSYPRYRLGQAMLQEVADQNWPISGFIGACGDDVEIVPLVYAGAEPGGHVEQAAFDRVVGNMIEGLAEAGPVDGLYLDLHGAMVTDDHEDGEGEILRRLREAVGPDLPIAVSLDLHGNLSEAFAKSCSLTTIYRTYPHIDMALTGERMVPLFVELLRRQVPYFCAYRQLDYIIPITEQGTTRAPCDRLYAMLDHLTSGDVINVELAMGFPPADISMCGPSIIAWGKTQEAADKAADTMLTALQEAESDFDNPLLPARDAVQTAMDLAKTADKPIGIADPQDNSGAGAIGDSTGLLQAMVDLKATNAALAMIWDPETAAKAHAAGIDGLIDVAIGGSRPDIGGPPVEVSVRVAGLSDGQFHCTGPMFKGMNIRLGPCALLHITEGGADIHVMVGSGRCQNADQTFFSHLGLDPTQCDVLGIKSAIHFLADYEPICEAVLFAEAPGANPCQIDLIPYKNLREGVRLGPNGPVWTKDRAPG